jgi:phage recombination protein Bet
MNARTQTRTGTQQQTPPLSTPASDKPVATTEPALPAPVARRGINEAQWRTMVNSLYPGADVNSVLMVWDYCKARRLDPLKKPCHIVPINVKDAKTGQYSWRDVVMPGIYEQRATAVRTGLYLGHTPPEYGQMIDIYGVKAPEYCAMTFYRWNEKAQQRIEYPVRVMFAEACATKKEKKNGQDTGNLLANDRWGRAPVQMLTKCCEAAGLREAFPDEIGGEHAAEEMEGRTFDVDPIPTAPAGKPATAAPQARTESEEVTHVPVEELRARLDSIGMPETEFFARFEIGGFDELPLSKVTEARAYLTALEQSGGG